MVEVNAIHPGVPLIFEYIIFKKSIAGEGSQVITCGSHGRKAVHKAVVREIQAIAIRCVNQVLLKIIRLPRSADDAIFKIDMIAKGEIGHGSPVVARRRPFQGEFFKMHICQVLGKKNIIGAQVSVPPLPHHGAAIARFALKRHGIDGGGAGDSLEGGLLHIRSVTDIEHHRAVNA